MTDHKNRRRVREPSPSVSVGDLHRVSSEEALAFVDRCLGPPEEWPSELIAYRLRSAFQKDWKTEVGQWLKAAEQFGFLEPVLHEIRSQAKRRSKNSSGEVDPNDKRHLKLHHNLAASRVIHYLTATGWCFRGYESETGGSVDIDCSLLTPSQEVMEFQVKAPDQPGLVANHMLVDGEHDAWVVEAVQHAARQLRRPASGPAMIAVCANRSWSLAWEPSCLVSELFGSTTQVGRRVELREADRGRFFTEEWAHVSGVLMLDLSRGETEARYICTILANPRATFPADPEWFPRSRVCILGGDRFRWVRGAPSDASGLPNRTRLVASPPDVVWNHGMPGGQRCSALRDQECWGSNSPGQTAYLTWIPSGGG